MATCKKKKKYTEAVYAVAGLGDNLIRIALKNNLDFNTLRELNPDVKGPAYILRMGQRVRLR